MKDEVIQKLLDRAADEEIGIAVKTNNPGNLQQLILDYIRRNPNPDHQKFNIAIPSIPEHIFIARKTTDLNEDF